MAQPPLLTLDGATLTFGGRPLFRSASLAVQPGERICLVGRNGSGKSTLLKICAGLVEPDAGERFVRPGTSVAYLPQDPDLSGAATLGDYAAGALDASERWRAEAAMEGLGVREDADPQTASGGERRRAALARLVAAAPDLMLLDEPTNHLDIHAIRWLEGWLGEGRAAFVLISHDRAFLSALTRATLWIDRGTVRRSGEGFAGFEAWRDKVWEEEEAEAKRLDKLIAQEAHWAVYGISARRTRNQGRLRRLDALRAERRERVARQGTAQMSLGDGPQSGKRVIEAEGLAKAFDGKPILRDFSIRIARGERVALVGPNGVGKTTLLNMLIGRETPDSGTVRLGTNLELAIFDQNRAALDPSQSLWESLTDDKAGGVRATNDQLVVRGQARHVIGYLKDFLFDERQARGPVSALSGGERARLLLAKIMARDANLLVLDEPTNDLDIETLDLLQELVADYPGTVLMVSHDRDFLDRTATTTVAMEGDGRAVVYAGGWSDYRAQRGEAAAGEGGGRPAKRKPPQAAAEAEAPARPETAKLGFNETRRLEALPGEIARLEAEIARLEAFLADPDLFQTAPAKFRKASDGLAERQDALAAAEEQWLTLEERREALAAAGGG